MECLYQTTDADSWRHQGTLLGMSIAGTPQATICPQINLMAVFLAKSC